MNHPFCLPVTQFLPIFASRGQLYLSFMYVCENTRKNGASQRQICPRTTKNWLLSPSTKFVTTEVKTCICAALRSAQTRGWVHLSQDLKYQPAEWRPRRPKQAKLCFGARKRSHQNLIAHRNASSSASCRLIFTAGAASDGPIGGPATPGEDPGASAIKPPHWALQATLSVTEGFLPISAQEFSCGKPKNSG